MIKNLVLPSGGINGLCVIGALKYIYEINLLENISTYVGSSVGAVISFFLIINYSIIEIRDIFLNVDFDILKDTNYSNLLENFGLDEGNKVCKFLKSCLRLKFGIDDITFIELFNKTNKKLVITGSNIENYSTVYFDYINTPNESVINAVRISISIPLMFTAIEKKYVDGGLFSPLPIDYFKRNELKECLAIALNRDINQPCESLETFISKITFSMQYIINRKQIDYAKYKIILKNISNPFNLEMDKEHKEKLLNDGYDECKIKFPKKLFPKIKEDDRLDIIH